jgi:hypothetical protein
VVRLDIQLKVDAALLSIGDTELEGQAHVCKQSSRVQLGLCLTHMRPKEAVQAVLVGRYN